MRQAGRYLPEYRQTRAQAGSFLDLCYNPELATEVTLQPIRRYGFDAAILFSDILVVPHALGQSVSFREGEGPVLAPIGSATDLEGLSAQGLLDHLAPVLQTVRNLSKALPSECALIGFAGAPWTVATYMIEGSGSKDFARAKSMIWRDPKLFAKLMRLLIEATFTYLSAQVDAGAEIIQIFDTWAGALPETEFRKWVIAPARELTERLKAAHPHIKLIGFPRGAGALYKDYALETKVDGLGLDWAVPLEWARDELQPHVTLQGNIDPLLLSQGGEALDQAIDRVLAILGKGRFIANLGHGIVPATPPDYVDRLVKRFRGQA